ncbi:response regulator transcription factor [Streptomyces sp. Wb2n-11]|uniref:response regulator transcription factor n=1 Tax=Streptomyces sp. Wb2n-11 TaxID=1030533 RepID=UPI000B00480B|nr:response regulator transcription factor [Streptomyces sp. Wb2n-11]
MTIRVLLADDQTIVRTGMAMILAAEDDIEVVAQAADGVAAIQQAEQHRPDVVLMDIRMPRLNGIEALRHLHRPGAAHAPQVVMVTTFGDDEYVHQALHHGACGFLLKDAGPRLLAEAVRSAASGEALISPSIAVRLLQRFVRPAAAPARPSPLSPRETEVAALVSRGHTNAEIAAALHISAGTVKTHLTNVQGKLGVRNRVEIAAWAWESGLGR